jgi:hypothetical protein
MLQLDDLRARILRLDRLIEGLSTETGMAGSTRSIWIYVEQHEYIDAITACRKEATDARELLKRGVKRHEAPKSWTSRGN